MFKSKFFKTLLLAAVIVGGIWVLVNRDKIKQPSDILTLAKNSLHEWFPPSVKVDGENPEPVNQYAPSDSQPNQPQLPAQLASHQNGKIQGVLRIATLRLNPSVAQLQSHEPIQMLADMFTQYDVITLQNLDRFDTTWLKSLVDQMNQVGAAGLGHLANGGRGGYVAISDRGRGSEKFQTAFIFNRQTIQLDQSKWYIVNDQDDVFENDPMVAWFRARGVPAEQAFTFSLASVSIRHRRPDLELIHLGALYRSIRKDGRGEDDVILMGDFQSDDRGLEAIQAQAGLAWVVSNRPTTVMGDRQFDNVLFSDAATVEFTGRGGVVNFPKKYGISVDDALAVSDRLPVWAEFSILENGQGFDGPAIPGRVAENDWDADEFSR